MRKCNSLLIRRFDMQTRSHSVEIWILKQHMLLLKWLAFFLYTKLIRFRGSNIDSYVLPLILDLWPSSTVESTISMCMWIKAEDMERIEMDGKRWHEGCMFLFFSLREKKHFPVTETLCDTVGSTWWMFVVHWLFRTWNSQHWERISSCCLIQADR